MHSCRNVQCEQLLAGRHIGRDQSQECHVPRHSPIRDARTVAIATSCRSRDSTTPTRRAELAFAQPARPVLKKAARRPSRSAPRSCATWRCPSSPLPGPCSSAPSSAPPLASPAAAGPLSLLVSVDSRAHDTRRPRRERPVRRRDSTAARRHPPARATCSARPWSARRARSCSTSSSRSAASPARTATAAAELLARLDLPTATKLVRAFSTYFHLANVTEQVHRGRDLRARRAAEGGLLARRRRPDRRGAEAARADLRRPRSRPARRPPGLHRPPDRGGPPVGAHQAAPDRRRCSSARQRGRRDDPRTAAPARRDHRPALADRRAARRRARARSTRPATRVYYLDELAAGAVPRRAGGRSPRELARVGVELPADARPLTFGTWIGGDRDGNPNVTPEVTCDVLLPAARARHPRRR